MFAGAALGSLRHVSEPELMAGLPTNVMELLQRGVPTYAAAEFLLLIRKLGSFASAAELSAQRQPPASPGEVEDYLALFQAAKLIRYHGDAFHFEPESEELRRAVDDLAACYNERPVTLIRTLYALADLKIRSFADSFRITEK
ncbi:MAG: hypothetical protein SFU53_15360 [Terrimicrobiaceae bacterium]|nr:hypothetical protein [Terrimicrobiaceae bacterium]